MLGSELGMVNFTLKCIPDLAGILARLVALTKNEVVKAVTKRWNYVARSNVRIRETITHPGARATIPIFF